MAEHSFQEIMRQWVRSRKAINANKLSCCPLEMFTDDYIANIEKEVMAWAKEHPRPVYPTWFEWLKSVGALPTEQTICHRGLEQPIPADIAEKLGIEPKEGT